MTQMMIQINLNHNLGARSIHLTRERLQILKCNLRIKTLEYLQVRKQRKLRKKSSPNPNEGGSALVPDVDPRSDKMSTWTIQMYQRVNEELHRRRQGEVVAEGANVLIIQAKIGKCRMKRQILTISIKGYRSKIYS